MISIMKLVNFLKFKLFEKIYFTRRINQIMTAYIIFDIRYEIFNILRNMKNISN